MGVSQQHEERVDLLVDMAGLLGVPTLRELSLPDGRRPDVTGFGAARKLLYIGEAKSTEGPADTATLRRLRHYVCWLGSYYRIERGAGIFALCHGEPGESLRWEAAVIGLGRSVGLPLWPSRAEVIPPSHVLQMFCTGPVTARWSANAV